MRAYHKPQIVLRRMIERELERSRCRCHASLMRSIEVDKLMRCEEVVEAWQTCDKVMAWFDEAI